VGAPVPTMPRGIAVGRMDMQSIRVSLLIGAVMGLGGGCGDNNGATSNVVDQSEGPAALMDAMKAASRAHIEGAVTQTNLIADQAGQAAGKDPHLVNPWGVGV